MAGPAGKGPSHRPTAALSLEAPEQRREPVCRFCFVLVPVRGSVSVRLDFGKAMPLQIPQHVEGIESLARFSGALVDRSVKAGGVGTPLLSTGIA